MYMLNMLKEQVSKNPDKLIVVRDESLTYSEFDRRTDLLARKLFISGCKPGTVIALQRRDSFEFALNFYAVLKASCCCAIINSAIQSSVVNSIMRENNIKVYWGDLDDVKDRLELNDEPLQKVELAVQELDYPIMCFTSGTTGAPKSVRINILQSENFIIYLGGLSSRYDINRFLYVSSNSFITGINNLLWAISFGVTTFFLKNESQNKNPFRILEEIEANHIDGMMCPTAMIKLLSENSSIRNRLPRSLKFFLFGGESIAFSSEAIEFFKQRKITFINCYGMTEVVGAATCLVDWNSLKPDVALPAGKPIPNVEIKLLPMEGDSIEDYAGNCGIVAIRLYRDEKIKTDWFISGDCATMDADGTITVLGRQDECRKIRGYFVNLSGVETTLCSLAGVEDAAVVAVTDRQNIVQICAAVVTNVDISVVKNDLYKLLPEYMLPTRYIVVDSIPYGKSFKKDRQMIKRLFYEKM